MKTCAIEGHKQQNHPTNITTTFKKDSIAIEAKIPENSYDEEDDTLPEEDMAIQNNKGTYFGPPTVHNFVLSGILKDAKTGEVLPFASVGIIGANNGVTTNADGFFTLLDVPTDTSTVLVQYIGYQQTEVYLCFF